MQEVQGDRKWRQDFAERVASDRIQREEDTILRQNQRRNLGPGAEDSGVNLVRDRLGKRACTSDQ